MKAKRMISLVMAIFVVLSVFPITVSAQAIQKNPQGVQIPEGFSLHYIGL